jgi:hypothetical protein
MLDSQTKLDLVNSDPNLVLSLNDGPLPDDEYLHYRLAGNYLAYTSMRRDPHIQGCLQKRRMAVIGRRMIVEPAKRPDGVRLKDKLAVSKAEAILNVVPFERICSLLLDEGFLLGFSVLQLDWHKKGDFIIPRPVPIVGGASRFTFCFYQPDNKDIPTVNNEKLDPKTEISVINGFELRLLTREFPVTGVRVPKKRFLVYTFGSPGGLPWGLGLGYQIYKWFQIKKEAVGAWLLHSDRLGAPPVHGTYPATLNPKNPEHAILIEKFGLFLRSIAPNGWSVMPEGFKAELLDTRAGSYPTHEKLILLAEAQISKAVLGERPFSDQAGGSFAANNSQVEDRESSLTDGDCDLLDEQMQDQLWSWIGEYNYPDTELPTIRREKVSDRRQAEQKKAEEDAKNTRSQRDRTLMLDLGLTTDDAYIKETYGDQWNLPAKPAAPSNEDSDKMLASIGFSEPENGDDFLINWEGYPIVVEFKPGQIRFPDRDNARPLKSGYGYFVGHIGDDGEDLDCYISPAVLKGKGTNRIFVVLQRREDGTWDEKKLMVGYPSLDTAHQAYCTEMPEEFIAGIWEMPLTELQRYRTPQRKLLFYGEWNAAKREKLVRGEIKGGFAGSGHSFPIGTLEDVETAWKLAHLSKKEAPDTIRQNILRIAKSLNLSLPDYLQAIEGQGACCGASCACEGCSHG